MTEFGADFQWTNGTCSNAEMTVRVAPAERHLFFDGPRDESGRTLVGHCSRFWRTRRESKMPSDSGSPTAREAALAQEASQSQALLEAAPDALIGVDRRGVIRFVNRQSEVLFGYDRDELVGTPLETLVPDSLRQVHRAHRASYNADPSTRPMGAGLK